MRTPEERAQEESPGAPPNDPGLSPRESRAAPPHPAAPVRAVARPGAMLARTLLALVAAITLVSSFLGAKSSTAEAAAGARAALVKETGVTSLALSGECSAVRHLGEGLQACLGDVAGGYCYHNSCDLVSMPCASGWSDPKAGTLAVRPAPPAAGAAPDFAAGSPLRSAPGSAR